MYNALYVSLSPGCHTSCDLDKDVPYEIMIQYVCPVRGHTLQLSIAALSSHNCSVRDQSLWIFFYCMVRNVHKKYSFHFSPSVIKVMQIYGIVQQWTPLTTAVAYAGIVSASGLITKTLWSFYYNSSLLQNFEIYITRMFLQLYIIQLGNFNLRF